MSDEDESRKRRRSSERTSETYETGTGYTASRPSGTARQSQSGTQAQSLEPSGSQPPGSASGPQEPGSKSVVNSRTQGPDGTQPTGYGSQPAPSAADKSAGGLSHGTGQDSWPSTQPSHVDTNDDMIKTQPGSQKGGTASGTQQPGSGTLTAPPSGAKSAGGKGSGAKSHGTGNDSWPSTHPSHVDSNDDMIKTQGGTQKQRDSSLYVGGYQQQTKGGQSQPVQSKGGSFGFGSNDAGGGATSKAPPGQSPSQAGGSKAPPQSVGGGGSKAPPQSVGGGGSKGGQTFGQHPSQDPDNLGPNEPERPGGEQGPSSGEEGGKKKKVRRKPKPCPVHVEHDILFHCHACNLDICKLCWKLGHTGTSERHHDVVFIEFMKQKEFAERLDNFNLDERLVEIDYQSKLCDKTSAHLKNLIEKLMKERAVLKEETSVCDTLIMKFGKLQAMARAQNFDHTNADVVQFMALTDNPYDTRTPTMTEEDKEALEGIIDELQHLVLERSPESSAAISLVPDGSSMGTGASTFH